MRKKHISKEINAFLAYFFKPYFFMADIQAVERGERLKKIRTDLKMDQSRFAELLETGQSTLSRMEKGMYELQNTQLSRLGKMGYNLNWLINGIGPMKLQLNSTAEPEIKYDRLTRIETFLKDHFPDF